jgi:predicted transglutaminase-like cysteine proteinase
MSNTDKVISIVFAAVATVLAIVAPASAAPAIATSPAFAQIGNTTSVPVGAAEFCRVHREDCAPNSSVVEAVPLTEALWNQLLTVNATVNSTVIPVTDEELYQVAELWTYPQGYGDCEDIALEKRRALINLGWAPSALLMSVVRERNGNGHAVLMVRTDRGDLVLDNQDGMIRLWSDTPYLFVKRQSQANPGQWVDILDQRAAIITANN